MRAPGSRTCGEIAALPYDVYNREAKREVKSHPLSFSPSTAGDGFPDTADMYAPEVYAHAKDLRTMGERTETMWKIRMRPTISMNSR